MHASQRRFISFALAAAIAASCAVVRAQARADEPLRLVVGFPPGGALDLLARQLAEQLRQSGDKVVLVENKPGASSRLAIEYVKRAAPNGRTGLLASRA